MLRLVGGLKIGNKTFSEKDSIGSVARSEYVSDNFYGGRVKDFLKTKEGFLLCRDRRGNIINIAYNEKQLSEEGKRLLNSVNEGEQEHGDMTDYSKMNIKELREKGKELGLTFRVGTTKEEIINAITNKGGDVD